MGLCARPFHVPLPPCFSSSPSPPRPCAGKLEAASLTLEEAKSILVYALGPEAPRVADVAARIKRLSVIEVDTSAMGVGAGGGMHAASGGRAFDRRAIRRLRTPSTRRPHAGTSARDKRVG